MVIRHSSFVIALVAWLMAACSAAAQGLKPKADDNAGGFISVPSPITSGVVSSVKRQAATWLHGGARVIVFEIQPGRSEYEDCLKLARYISMDLQGARTVAFVSKPLSGHAVMVALAADELVMSSKATIGDIGIDEKFISPVMRTGYSDLARRRRPSQEFLILGMLDKGLEVWEVRTAEGKRYVLASDLEKIDREQRVIGKEIIIPQGQLGLFDGDKARVLDLAQRLAESRGEVAEAYGLPPKSAIESVRVGVEWRAVRIRLEDFVGPLMEEYVRRHIKDQLERGKNFLIFEIDSPGGYAFTGMDLAEFIADLKGVKTVAYVPKQAISAAAFIALGCDEIVMHRDAILGDCGV
ncbi:MAG: hypothetical protein HY000_35320, partial [Planctomycetes bacterium]|nr:hypothetical protein [Planctomycetota bacterium]